MKNFSPPMKWLALAGITGIIYLAGGSVRAQSTQPETKKMKVKIIKNINGVETMRDTVIDVSGTAAIPDLSILRNNLTTISGTKDQDRELLLNALKESGRMEVKDLEKILREGGQTGEYKVKIMQVGPGQSVNLDSLLKNRELRLDKLQGKEGKLKIRKFQVTVDELKNPEGENGMVFRSKTGDSLMVFKQIIIMHHEITPEEKKLLDSKAKAKTSAGKIKELNLETVNVYPNPSSGNFKVSFNAPKKGNTSVALLDNTGRELFREDLGNFNGTFEKEYNLEGSSKGIYFLQVTQGKQVYNKKVLLQ